MPLDRAVQLHSTRGQKQENGDSYGPYFTVKLQG